jgi:hypothetical protein
MRLSHSPFVENPRIRRKGGIHKSILTPFPVYRFACRMLIGAFFDVM